jgi:hypothetical protein
MRFPARAIVLVAMLGAGIVPALARQTPCQSAQTPTPPATGAITGAVVDGSSGEAIGGAIVFIAPVEPGRTIPITQTRQATDGRGRFAFTEVPEGAISGVRIEVRVPRRRLRTRILTNRAPARPCTSRATAGSRISASLSGNQGPSPVPCGMKLVNRSSACTCARWRRFRIQGRDDLVAGPATTTNDRGEYRLSGLTPGKYIIQVPSVQDRCRVPQRCPPPSREISRTASWTSTTRTAS